MPGGAAHASSTGRRRGAAATPALATAVRPPAAPAAPGAFARACEASCHSSIAAPPTNSLLVAMQASSSSLRGAVRVQRAR